MRKTLGILNIVAGVIILALFYWLRARGTISFEDQNLGDIMIGLALFHFFAGTSLVGGVLILITHSKKRRIFSILAVANLIFDGLLLFVLGAFVLLAFGG